MSRSAETCSWNLDVGLAGKMIGLTYIIWVNLHHMVLVIGRQISMFSHTVVLLSYWVFRHVCNVLLQGLDPEDLLSILHV